MSTIAGIDSRHIVFAKKIVKSFCRQLFKGASMTTVRLHKAQASFEIFWEVKCHRDFPGTGIQRICRCRVLTR